MQTLTVQKARGELKSRRKLQQTQYEGINSTNVEIENNNRERDFSVYVTFLDHEFDFSMNRLFRCESVFFCSETSSCLHRSSAALFGNEIETNEYFMI